MAAERQDALREFVAVTGTEEDRARFFLESAGWDLQVAARGRVRRAGRGLRGAGVRRAKPVAAEAHSHPAGLRPDPTQASGSRGRLPRVASSAGAWGESGPAPALPCGPSASPSASPARGVSETWGTAATRVEKGAWGRGGRAGLGRGPGGWERPGPGSSGGEAEVVVGFHFRRSAAGGGRSAARELAHAPSYPVAGRNYL